METKCQKCGAPANTDQAFCSKCGAVIGMSDTEQKRGDDWNLAATMVGQKLPPPSSAAANPTVMRPAYTGSPAPTPPAQTPQWTPPPPPARTSNAMLLAIIGFVAVLLIGGLLILLFYLNSQG
jgi:predicted nucleic acid-binding Zn ribbon protein